MVAPADSLDGVCDLDELSVTGDMGERDRADSSMAADVMAMGGT